MSRLVNPPITLFNMLCYTKQFSYSPAQRLVRAGAQKAISNQFCLWD
jgi:hypothetical protein